MKKVWIASIFACIMLIVPLTSVVGANEVGEDCNCIPISNQYLVRIERLLDRLESRISFILLRYGHIPEVAEKCQEILDIINSDDFLTELCDFLNDIINFYLDLYEILPYPLWVIVSFPSIFVAFLYAALCMVP